MVLVGEQPGDIEDREGEPFVGPAGRLLDRALADAGLERSAVYLTNAVKHFKFRRQAAGKRRLHAKPDPAEIAACRPWLAAEVAAVRPRVLVILGATAARSIVGPAFRVTRERGVVHRWRDFGAAPALTVVGEEGGEPMRSPPPDMAVVATVHPSSVLRSDDRAAGLADLVADLRVAASV